MDGWVGRWVEGIGSYDYGGWPLSPKPTGWTSRLETWRRASVAVRVQRRLLAEFPSCLESGAAGGQFVFYYDHQLI